MKFIHSSAIIALVMMGIGCSRFGVPSQRAFASQVRAPDLMIQYGCPTCHVIPNVPGAVGKVGPPLGDLAQRSYLAGTLQNSPENLVLWIQHPQQIHPGTAMPEMGVTAADATRIAAFLQANR
jgi:cytochrome c2